MFSLWAAIDADRKSICKLSQLNDFTESLKRRFLDLILVRNSSQNAHSLPPYLFESQQQHPSTLAMRGCEVLLIVLYVLYYIILCCYMCYVLCFCIINSLD